MQNAKSTVDYYLDKFRHGKHEDAFYGLIDWDAAVIPELINAYEASEDTRPCSGMAVGCHLEMETFLPASADVGRSP